MRAEDLHLRLGRSEVLRGASLALRRGEVMALIGPNGAGKSTLLACLSGALSPDRGRVRIDGQAPAALGPAGLARRRAVLEQSPASAAPFRLAELVALAIPPEIPPAEAGALTARALAAVGLGAFAGRRIDRLSGGERHRGHMARALAQHLAGRALGAGGWLLLDEPTASLDLRHQAAVLQAARAAAAEGAGVLAVLHDLSLAAAMADRLALMAEGRILAEGPPAAVLTPERLAAVYGLPVAVAEGPGGHPAITPIYRASQGDSTCSSP
ncbi:heme ABC transporter ATP-binding protein [Paralimibaculum aggregatum]|uniref:Heme ABC transporter ATP-binding protein n=1 Tax=Paralimibaculum aggregatum TaxID=3036245 RepID=A0ABQ6LMK3_9RHOB|nr:ATP-binding cassette domain-containing protein [Limibaculum sp. NKW23]GMG83525.1 heme ABC transporter ATP-binding protein [Limibaculum sp. NKW23]